MVRSELTSTSFRCPVRAQLKSRPLPAAGPTPIIDMAGWSARAILVSGPVCLNRCRTLFLVASQLERSIPRFAYPPRRPTTAGQRQPSQIDWETHCSRRSRRTRRRQERQHRDQGSSWLIPLVRAAVGRNCGPVIRRASLDRETLGGASPVGHQCPHHTLPDALVKYHLDLLP